MHYELWDTASRNLLYDFLTEEEALEAVRQLRSLNGPGTTDDMALMHVGDDGSSMTVALGSALEEYVRASSSHQPQRTA